MTSSCIAARSVHIASVEPVVKTFKKFNFVRHWISLRQHHRYLRTRGNHQTPRTRPAEGPETNWHEDARGVGVGRKTAPGRYRVAQVEPRCREGRIPAAEPETCIQSNRSRTPPTLRRQRPVRLERTGLLCLRTRASEGAFLDRMLEHQAHSRTPILLRFLVKLPSTEPRGRWRERGKMRRG